MKTLIILAAASLIAGTGASAQTSPMAKPAKAAPAMAPADPMKPAKAAHKAMPAAGGRMVSTTTKSGKKITYDCSKKGNMNKKACKG